MSVKVQQCKRCMRIFQSYGATICPDCADKMDQDFIKVKEYIYDNPDAKVIEISKETGVAEKTVLDFLREGRLSISHNDDILTCIECGNPIKSGKYCDACTCKLESALRSVFQADVQKKARKEDAKTGNLGRMHYDFKKRTF